jgi:hypothetical protein
MEVMMEKIMNKRLILGVFGLGMIVFIGVIFILNNNTYSLKDNTLFKDEYEKLNNVASEDGKKYPRVDISDYDNLENQISLLNDLIGLMIDNSLEDILHHDLYNKYEEDEDGGGFLDILGIHENDIPNINFIITSIREDYFASLEDEE